MTILNSEQLNRGDIGSNCVFLKENKVGEMPWGHKAQGASNIIFLPNTEEPIHSLLQISQQGIGPGHYLCKTGLSIQQWFNNQSCIPEKCCDSFLGWTHGSWFPKVFWKYMCQKVYRSVSVQAGLHFSQLTDSCAHECLWLLGKLCSHFTPQPCCLHVQPLLHSLVLRDWARGRRHCSANREGFPKSHFGVVLVTCKCLLFATLGPFCWVWGSL